MDVSEIRDEESLRAWLESLPARIGEEEARRWAVLIAHRAAMRVLPVFWRWSLSPEAEDIGITPLPTLRALLFVGSYLYNPRIAIQVHQEEVAPLMQRVRRSASAAGALVRYPVVYSAIYTARAVFGDSAARASAAIANSIGYDDSDDFVWKQVRAECRRLLRQDRGESFPLIGTRKNVLWDRWEYVRKHLTSFSNWQFWIDWYDKALNGEPQDWDMLTKVALIPSEDWDKGADHVNALIARMVEQHGLAGEARSLKAEIEALRSELELLKHRGHNSPPELVEETEAALCQTTIIWAALDEAETELEKPEPDASLLAAIAQGLLAAVKAFGLYCAKLGDMALQSVAKKVGTGVLAYGGYLASQNPQVQAFAETLRQFAKSLGQ